MGLGRRDTCSLVIAGCLAVIWFPLSAHADLQNTKGVTVSAVVLDHTSIIPNPAVQFSGIAAPSAVVSIHRNTVAVGAETLTASGEFSFQLSNQPVGQVAYVITAVDGAGVALAPVTFALNLAMGTNTIVSGVFLGPSISLDKTAVKLGQFLTASGSTAPSSAVTVSVNSVRALSFSVTADTNGRWSKLINSQEVGLGTHTVSARAVAGGSTVSANSATVSFAVNPVEQCDGKKTGNLNCDAGSSPGNSGSEIDRVDLTDLSILMYFWQQTNPSNARADINGDGRVDIIDFSILLYQWTG